MERVAERRHEGHPHRLPEGNVMASCPKCGNRKVKRKGTKRCTHCGDLPPKER